MFKILVFFVILLAKDALAEAENDQDCSEKCGNIDNYKTNGLYCTKNCKSEVCSKSCYSAKIFAENKVFCNYICYAYRSDICKKECETDEDLETNYAFCPMCGSNQGCRTKCDYDNFNKNVKFCGHYCSLNSKSTEICENTCSTVELVLSASNCNNGCYRYIPVICERNCSSTEEFLTNYYFCTRECNQLNLKLCKNLCSSVDLFNENHDFCFNSCDFPEKICKEKCFNVENFALNADLCYRGCSYLGDDICTNDCNSSEKVLNNKYCNICNRLPLISGGGIVPTIEIRPKTCISLLCG